MQNSGGHIRCIMGDVQVVNLVKQVAYCHATPPPPPHVSSLRYYSADRYCEGIFFQEMHAF